MHTITDYDTELIEAIRKTDDIAVLFDEQLNYVALNDAAFIHMQRTSEELIGRCILDLFPDVIASSNHRNLLRALSGETIINSRLKGRLGDEFIATYMPVFFENSIIGIAVNAQKIKVVA